MRPGGEGDGCQATNSASSACDQRPRPAELPGHRLPSSAPDSDGSVPGGAASPRGVRGPSGRVRPHRHGLPKWVEQDFRGYSECGILAHGFARARGEDCGHERLIPFSCRGICPSCNARRMCEVAAHLTDHVLPHVPARQWVLSVPKRLRPYLHHDVRVAGAVLQILMRAIRGHRREALVPPALEPRSAASRPARSRQLLSSLRLLPQRPSPLSPRRARRRLQQGRRQRARVSRGP